jgi:DMSO/TMAO reductase YedYZ molybdopterin-dependent catalytic subunit
MLSDSERKRSEEARRQDGRLPPGQSLTLKWPVLHEGSPPRFDPETWDLTAKGLVENPLRLSWDEFKQLPRKRIVADFHCVTAWSKFDNDWSGVAVADVLARVRLRPEATQVMIHSYGGYTTNLSLADLSAAGNLFAHGHGGEPLTREHGWPMRLVVPQLYFWKSAKWVRGLVFLDEEKPGFWESYGYHIRGDPWKEERYS